MTYAEFHLYFTIPQSLVFWLLCWRYLSAKQCKQLFAGASLLACLALIWTTPWDNYLIYKKIWWYSPQRVMGTIGYVPIEEYFFFVIQCYFTAGFLGILMKFIDWQDQPVAHEKSKGDLLLSLSLGLFLFGLYCLSVSKLLYLGLILVWACPIFLIQQSFGRKFLLRNGKIFALGLLVPSLYLSLCDAYAIHENIWTISRSYTIGLQMGPLPLEEATFFFATNLMLIQGLILFLHPQSQKQALALWQSWRVRGHA